MARNIHLLATGNEALDPLNDAFGGLNATIDQLTAIADARSSARLAKLKTRMEEFTANVTFVGQVKAGKSTLVNIMAGASGAVAVGCKPMDLGRDDAAREHTHARRHQSQVYVF